MFIFQPDQFLNLFHHAAVQAPEPAQQMAQSRGAAREWPLDSSPHQEPTWGSMAADENLNI